MKVGVRVRIFGECNPDPNPTPNTNTNTNPDPNPDPNQVRVHPWVLQTVNQASREHEP